MLQYCSAAMPAVPDNLRTSAGARLALGTHRVGDGFKRAKTKAADSDFVAPLPR
jgi:hypothetical protein